MGSVKMVSEEETTGIDRDGHTTDSDLDRAENSDVANFAHGTEPAAPYTPTDSLLIDRLVARMPLSGRWIVAALGLVLLLVPAILAYVDGVGIAPLFADFRAQFTFPFLIVYLLVACHLLLKTRESVTQALRPLVQLDEKTFIHLVNRGCRVSPIGELSALGVGMFIGLGANIVFETLEPGPYLLRGYAYLSTIVMWGVVGWATYVGFAMTRLTNTLLRQPLRVDIFDLRPFEPIGRQSLWLSLTFVGGMMLGLLSSDLAEEEFRLAYLILNGIMIALIVAVFFLNTHNVHWVLATTKKQELELVEHHLATAYYRLRKLLIANQDTYAVATEMNALAISKEELKETRTWPYNTEMLRTIFISIVTPLLVGLARVVAVLLGS